MSEGRELNDGMLDEELRATRVQQRMMIIIQFEEVLDLRSNTHTCTHRHRVEPHIIIIEQRETYCVVGVAGS